MLKETGLAVLDIIVITAAAGIIIGVLNRSGLSFALTQNLVSLVDKNLFLLLVAAAGISIVLGMGMPTISVYVLLAALMRHRSNSWASTLWRLTCSFSTSASCR